MGEVCCPKHKEDNMTRKVSLWIVIALVCALAATVAAVIVLAAHDERGDRSVAGPQPGETWPHAWSDGGGQRPAPMMGDLQGGWGDGRGTPILPWVLFALATGTAVGLLVAWSPWRTPQAAVATSPPNDGRGSMTQVMAAQPTGETRPAAATLEAQTTREVDATEATLPGAEAQTLDAEAETLAAEAQALEATGADAGGIDATTDAGPTEATPDTSGETHSEG
jgi:hypothetical protein